MRIANAIAELRRPPSIASSDHQPTRAQSLSYSLPTSSAHQSLNSPFGLSPVTANYTAPTSAVLSLESPPITGGQIRTPVAVQESHPRGDSDPGTRPSISNDADDKLPIGLGLGIPAELLAPLPSAKSNVCVMSMHFYSTYGFGDKEEPPSAVIIVAKRWRARCQCEGGRVTSYCRKGGSRCS